MIQSAVTVSLVPEAAGGPFVFWHEIDAAIQTAHELGFDAIEVFPSDGKTLRELDLSNKSKGLVKIAAIGTGAGWVKHKWLLCHADFEHRRQAVQFVKSIMEVAAQFGAATIIGSMQGRSSPELPKSQAKAHLRESLELLDQYAGKIGGNLLYEPLNRYETDQANTIGAGIALIEGLERTKLLADLFHMNIEESSISEAIRLGGDKIGHVHFADSNRKAIGNGHMSVEPIVEALKEIEYSGYLSAEVFPQPDPLSAAKKTIESFRKFVTR